MRAVKAYKYKLKPNAKFETACGATLTICRELYNAALQARRAAYRINGLSINYHAQAIQLPQIKQARADVNEVYSQILQDTLRRVDKAFDAFFRRIKSGEAPGYPRFKSASRFASFTYPQSGFRLAGDKLHLSKIGSCRIRLSRPVEGTLKTCTIKRAADGWYVVFTVEENQSRFFPKTGAAVGIDVGIENFATLSTGAVIENPKYYRAAERALKTAHARFRVERAREVTAGAKRSSFLRRNIRRFNASVRIFSTRRRSISSESLTQLPSRI